LFAGPIVAGKRGHRGEQTANRPCSPPNARVGITDKGHLGRESKPSTEGVMHLYVTKGGRCRNPRFGVCSKSRKFKTEVPFSGNGKILLVVGREEIEANPDISALFFHTKASREASRAFLSWLRENNGRALKSEVAMFADALSKGDLATARLSRSNFYASVLRAYVRAGLIAIVPELDHETRKVRQVYRATAQPIAKRRPAGPSLVLNAHLVAEMWNKQFETSDDLWQARLRTKKE